MALGARRSCARCLEGVAQRGADLVEAAEADTGLTISTLRIDGGMTANPTFVQAVANAAGKPVEVSPITEATTLGAGYLAGLADGTWSSFDRNRRYWSPRQSVEPNGPQRRDEWAAAIQRSIALDTRPFSSGLLELICITGARTKLSGEHFERTFVFVDTVEAMTSSGRDPVVHPTAEDVALLSFAQQVELTMRDLYDVAVAGGVFADPDTAADRHHAA